MKYNKIINDLLELKNNLDEQKKNRISEVLSQIELEFINDADKINEALKAFGYVEPEDVVAEEVAPE